MAPEPEVLRANSDPATGARRLLTIHAHPDDESSKGGGSAARYAAAGVGTVLVCCTGGEAGTILNPALDRPEVQARLAESAKRDPQPEIQFRADKTTPYQRVTEVLSDAARVGLTRIGFVSEPGSN